MQSSYWLVFGIHIYVASHNSLENQLQGFKIIALILIKTNLATTFK